jgi:hypothetical protein
MTLNIYVGPYAEVPIDVLERFDWSRWDGIVADGRMEASDEDEPLILIPNVPLPGVTRQMDFDRYGDLTVVPITLDAICRENQEFIQLIQPILNAYPGKLTIRWGIVPRIA